MNCCVLSLCNTESKLFAIYTAAKQKKIFVCSCLYAHADFNGKNKMHLKLPNVYNLEYVSNLIAMLFARV